MPLAALFPFLVSSTLARPLLFALEALRRTLDGETMTTLGGARTPWNVHPYTPCARLTGFYHRVAAPITTRLRPFVADRNICHFVWYGGFAGEGLSSVRVAPIGPHPRASALSCPRSPFTGRDFRAPAFIMLVLLAASFFTLLFQTRPSLPLRSATQPIGVRYTHAGEAERGLLQRREGR